jgi:hypothetical protein
VANPHYLPYITTAAESCILQQSHTFYSDVNCVTHSADYSVSRFLPVKPMKYNDSLSAFFNFIFPNIYESHTFQSYECDGYISISCSFTQKKKTPTMSAPNFLLHVLMQWPAENMHNLLFRGPTILFTYCSEQTVSLNCMGSMTVYLVC